MRTIRTGSKIAVALILVTLLMPFVPSLVAADTTVILSGRVVDPIGNGIPDQTVVLRLNGDIFSSISTTTGPHGSYIFRVAPGLYTVTVSNRDFGNDPSVNAPQFYSITTNPLLSLSADTTLDLPIPIKRVRVNVQDPYHQPLAGATIATSQAPAVNLTLGPFPAQGPSSYNAITTTTEGALLWLFPPTVPMHFTATPPPGSPYQGLWVTAVAHAHSNDNSWRVVLPPR